MDDMKIRMGEGDEVEARNLAIRRRHEAAARLEAMRKRLRWGDKFDLYLFEEEEVSRGEAFRRWKLCCNVVLAMVRLRLPMRRSARNRKTWRKAMKVAAASSRFRAMGADYRAAHPEAAEDYYDG